MASAYLDQITEYIYDVWTSTVQILLTPLTGSTITMIKSKRKEGGVITLPVMASNLAAEKPKHRSTKN